jgi:hypothetical protein
LLSGRADPIDTEHLFGFTIGESADIRDKD